MSSMTISRTKLVRGALSGGVGCISSVLCQFLKGFPNPRQAGFAAEDFEGAEERGRGLASADGDADGLEHLAGFDGERSGGGTEGSFEAVVRELSRGESFERLGEHTRGQDSIAFFRNQ